MNKENFRKVLDHIKADPACWKQDKWHCGTQHCFAGWAQLLAGNKASDLTVRRDARIFLDLTMAEANHLFSSNSTIEDFEDALYDRDGYDRYGYDRYGYDRDGYGRDGYDRDRYDRNGYDRDGYDCDGYDCDRLDSSNKPRPGDQL